MKKIKGLKILVIVLLTVLFFIITLPWSIKNESKLQYIGKYSRKIVKKIDLKAELEKVQIIDEIETLNSISPYWEGIILNDWLGRVPTVDNMGTETYYNLDMNWIIELMRSRGFSEEEYPYWVREDGCKMLGNYIMCAANLEIYPRGGLVMLTRGVGIVCDTGDFVSNNPYGFDIAVIWE